MYAKGTRASNTTDYWWLASPSANFKDILCCVNDYAKRLDSYYSYTKELGISPLVSLKYGIPVQVEE